MKHILIILFLIPLTSYSQKVFSVKYSNQSDVKVFVVEYENICGFMGFDFVSSGTHEIYIYRYIYSFLKTKTGSTFM